ncbi:Glycogenin-2, partial [Stegodyphus mimosarum]
MSSERIKPTGPISKVTFFPVSDGKTDALIVTIKKLNSETTDDVPKVIDSAKPNTPTVKVTPAASNKSLMDSSKSNSQVAKISPFASSKSTMTDSQNVVSLSSQMSSEESLLSNSTNEHTTKNIPCLKHAAQNISRKASDIPSEKISLCNKCSKSMLSYIFVVQDFLDSLAKEICSDIDSTQCLQCLREKARADISSREDTTRTAVYEANVSTPRRVSRKSSDLRKPESKWNDESRYSKSLRGEKERNREERDEGVTSSRESMQRKENIYHQHQSVSDESKEKMSPVPIPDSRLIQDNRSQQIISDKQGKPEQVLVENQKDKPHQIRVQHFRASEGQKTSPSFSPDQPSVSYEQHSSDQQHFPSVPERVSSASRDQISISSLEQLDKLSSSTHSTSISQEADSTLPLQIEEPQFESSKSEDMQKQVHETPATDSNYSNIRAPASPLSEGVDGIMSTLSNAEREIYDTARNGAGWESLSESLLRLSSPTSSQIAAEAFVTMCRNNAEALGCLAVGTSLLLSRTTRTLCVLVSDGVSNAFKGPLSSVFHIVQYVRALDSLGTTKLALLEQPELGISFDKLNVWRLVQFSKCVFLNPDTLVIQNCDELFCHDELSAVPDIGWPDCFNSGVFVFVPSVHTFWNLLEFAENQGSYDGGDQGLLNSYFSSWSDDINKKLSFIYNLMANVSYTYSPAFRQFGRNVKIVQFHGSYKPWHVKFFSNSGQISPASTVHPTYVQFVHAWINIFRISVLRLLSQDIQTYASSQKTVCAVELLRFFPLPSESEAEFYLTPPSVRLRLTEKKLFKPSSPALSEPERRKSAEYTPPPKQESDVLPETEVQKFKERTTRLPDRIPVTSTPEVRDPSNDENSSTDAGADVVDIEGGFREKAELSQQQETISDENVLPGAEVGNYQGMKAWEQGRMDYQGVDSSENIIKRLQFLMSQ